MKAAGSKMATLSGRGGSREVGYVRSQDQVAVALGNQVDSSVRGEQLCVLHQSAHKVHPPHHTWSCMSAPP